jgi:hypothetical protein
LYYREVKKQVCSHQLLLRRLYSVAINDLKTVEETHGSSGSKFKGAIGRATFRNDASFVHKDYTKLIKQTISIDKTPKCCYCCKLLSANGLAVAPRLS